MLDQLAITDSSTTLIEMSGATLKTILEDVCDKLVSPDPYYQQGGDMVRVGGLDYSCTLNAGRRADLWHALGRQVVKQRRLNSPRLIGVAGSLAWRPDMNGSASGRQQTLAFGATR